jgi:hypothetical protein
MKQKLERLVAICNCCNRVIRQASYIATEREIHVSSAKNGVFIPQIVPNPSHSAHSADAPAFRLQKSR